MVCRFTVEGRPVPQGSMTASYNRTTGTSHVHHVQGSALALWRASIREAARAAGAEVSAAPIVMTVQFGIPRPKQHMRLVGGKYVPKLQHLDKVPSIMPDIDKLLRAVMDALSGVCYRDDSQVVSVMVDKVYGDITTITIAEYKPRAQGSLWE